MSKYHLARLTPIFRRSYALYTMADHYLPQMQLRRFAKGKKLYVFDRVLKAGREDVPRNIASITGYYTIKRAAGKSDKRIERFFSRIETGCSPVLDALERGEAISDEQCGILATFLGLLCTRVPAFEQAHDRVADNLGKILLRRMAGTPEAASRLIGASGRAVSFSAESLADFVASGKFTVRPNRNSSIRLMLAKAGPIIEAIDSMDWWILRSDGKARFIIADGPMGFQPEPGSPSTYGVATPGVTKFLSISPAVCLMLRDRAEKLPAIRARCVTETDVRLINSRIALSSVRLVIGQDRSDVESAIQGADSADSGGEVSMVTLEWYDRRSGRSMVVSHQRQRDTRYPLTHAIRWHCRSCGWMGSVAVGVASPTTPQDPDFLTKWLDAPCLGCGRCPRDTQTRLGEA